MPDSRTGAFAVGCAGATEAGVSRSAELTTEAPLKKCGGIDAAFNCGGAAFVGHGVMTIERARRKRARASA